MSSRHRDVQVGTAYYGVYLPVSAAVSQVGLSARAERLLVLELDAVMLSRRPREALGRAFGPRAASSQWRPAYLCLSHSSVSERLPPEWYRSKRGEDKPGRPWFGSLTGLGGAVTKLDSNAKGGTTDAKRFPWPLGSVWSSGRRLVRDTEGRRSIKGMARSPDASFAESLGYLDRREL